MVYLVLDKNMLGFYKIGRVSILVQASSDESSAHSSTVFPRHQNEISFSASLELRWGNIKEPENARDFERRVLDAREFTHHFVIECVLRDVVTWIGVSVLKYSWMLIWINIRAETLLHFLHGFLDILCEIKFVSEVKRLFILNLLDHLNILLIGFVDLEVGRVT